MRSTPPRAGRWALGLTLALGMTAPQNASAFCGFYVGGADAKLFNNATMVVLMREGMRTVLSMQNNYQGPPERFAMVVPVPVVLQKENVKTLPREVFAHVDTLAAPRLVEYWEQDPCAKDDWEGAPGGGGPMIAAPSPAARGAASNLGVRIEAQFSVGEYEVVILSAQDSTGLDTWLRQNKYAIPEGAEPILRPYVAAGMKFFVAKVDPQKVRFEGGQAMLSPLRFHYDTDSFNLPVRLGLLNSAGTQDLIVHILARGKRYEVANYPNVTIPTNYDVADSARERFGEFYAALFDRTVESNPGAVVTEYSWDAQSCDPCPTPALNPSELATLGADVLVSTEPETSSPVPRSPGGGPMPSRIARPINPDGFTLTRLHARYTKSSLGQDLVFKEAPGIVGGREEWGQKQQPHGTKPASVNNFQGRYIIRHAWTGPIACNEPRRGIWGGPPSGNPQAGNSSPKVAVNTAFAPRGKIELASFMRQDVPELKIAAAAPPAAPAATAPAAPAAPASTTPPSTPAPGTRGCGACSFEGGGSALLPGSLAALLALLMTERRRRRHA